MTFPNEPVQRTSHISYCFFLVRCRGLHHDLLGDERENLVVVALIVSGTVTMLSLDFEVISLLVGKQEMEDVDAQMVMICQVQR